MRGPGFDPHRQIQSSLVGHTCHLSTLEVGAEGSGVQGHPWLHRKVKANLAYMKPCLTKKQNKIATPPKAAGTHQTLRGLHLKKKKKHM